ncbi:MAG: hypothetical protein WD044_17615 [Dongiaceae bacterium]
MKRPSAGSMKRPSAGRVLVFVLVGVSLAAVAAGLSMTDSPWHERDQRIDERRTRDLESLDGAVRDHVEAEGRLPLSLDELGSQWETVRRDPETGVDYEYRVIDDRRFELCATFTMQRDVEGDPTWTRWQSDFFDHPPGRHCFERNAAEDEG